jgi:hypothetical protein
MGPTDTRLNNVAPLGNQAVNGENKHHLDVSGETDIFVSAKE